MNFSNTDYRSIISTDDVLPDIIKAAGIDKTIRYTLAAPEDLEWYEYGISYSDISSLEYTFINHALTEISQIIDVDFIEVDNKDQALFTFIKVEEYISSEEDTLGLASYDRGWDKTDISWKNFLGDDIGGSEKETLLHEICHGLGLDHPNGDGDEPQFNTDITVMSYTDGLLPFKEKLRNLDIEALQNAWNTSLDKEFVHGNDPTIDFNKYTIVEANGNTTVFRDSENFAYVYQDEYDQPIRTDYLDQFVKVDGSHHPDWEDYDLLAAEKIGNQNQLLWSLFSVEGTPTEYWVTNELMEHDPELNSYWYSADFEQYTPNSPLFRPIALEFGIDPLSGKPIEGNHDISEPTPEPQPEPTPEPQPQPTPEPQPEPTPEPQPEPTPEPQPEPTPEPDEYEPPSTKNKFKGTKKDDDLNGTKKSDFIDGKKGDDILTGNKGNDILKGGKGQDILMGSKGEDYLDGSKGIDILNGGKGADVFQISKGFDLVDDFNIKQGDRIALDKKGKYSIIDDRDGVLIMASAKKQLFLDGVDYDDVIAAGVDLFVQPV